MGLLTKPIKTLDDLFVHTLQDVYYAEQQITKALPQMISKVSDAQLKDAFQQHLGETKNQIKRLEQVFTMHGAEKKAVKCPAIDGIIDEAQEILGDAKDLRGSLVIHNNFSNRTALRRRWFIQISALSTFDGWVLASHGDNG